EIDQRITCDSAVGRGLNNSFFNRGPKLLRNRTAKDFIFKGKATAARQWFKDNLAIPKLSAAAGLLFVPALHFGALSNRLFVRHFGRMQHHFHVVTLL